MARQRVLEQQQLFLCYLFLPQNGNIFHNLFLNYHLMPQPWHSLHPPDPDPPWSSGVQITDPDRSLNSSHPARLSESYALVSDPPWIKAAKFQEALGTQEAMAALCDDGCPVDAQHFFDPESSHFLLLLPDRCIQSSAHGELRYAADIQQLPRYCEEHNEFVGAKLVLLMLISEEIRERHLCWKNLCLLWKCCVNRGGSHFSTLLKCCACNPQCDNLIDCQQLLWFGCSFRSPPSNCSKARYIHTHEMSSSFLLLSTARGGVSNQGLDSLPAVLDLAAIDPQGVGAVHGQNATAYICLCLRLVESRDLLVLGISRLVTLILLC